jgi:phosphotransferase system  glucose/maltose/N-acetylglucosamine-specific IIC component
MSKFLSAVTLFLMSSPLFAAMKEMDAANTPAETVDMLWVVVFGVIFLGSIVGFFVYLFYTDRGNKPKE